MYCILLQNACCFGAFCPAFWCISHCVLVHFALRFGAFCIAFWCFLPCVLVLFTPNYAAKGTRWCVSCIFKQSPMVIYPPLCAPCFAPSKLAQYSQKCGWNGGMARKIAAIMLNFVRKTLHFLSRCFRQHSITSQ